MKQISRNIGYTHATWGDRYYLLQYGHIVSEYMTLEHVLMARKEADFQKKSWNKCNEDIPAEIKSDLMYYHPDGMFYCELKLTNYEILVSDLYNNKKDCQQVRKWLDENRWGYKYLNLQKVLGVECCREYAGILPTKTGYIIMDTDNKIHAENISELDEAVNIRNHLRDKGVLI